MYGFIVFQSPLIRTLTVPPAMVFEGALLDPLPQAVATAIAIAASDQMSRLAMASLRSVNVAARCTPRPPAALVTSRPREAAGRPDHIAAGAPAPASHTDRGGRCERRLSFTCK